MKDDGSQADGEEPAGKSRTDSVNWGAGRESCRKEKKAKDPKEMAAGRAGAATRTAAQKRLLKQLQAAKESLRPGVSKEADSKDRQRTDERPREQSNWTFTPLIIGACLACGALVLARLPRLPAMQIGPAFSGAPLTPRPKSRISSPIEGLP